MRSDTHKINARGIAHAAAVLALTIAIATVFACVTNARQIQRAQHETLPTPTRGYFYPVQDDGALDASSEVEADGFEPFDDASLGGEPILTLTSDEVSANPELAQLFNKIDAGTATDADYQRIEAILNSSFGGGTATQIVTGIITDISGNTITITAFLEPDTDADTADADEEEETADATPTPTPTPLRTDVRVSDDTQFLVVAALATTDIKPGDEITATAERNEAGRIRARTLSILEVDEDSPFAVQTGRGSGRPAFGSSPFGASGRPRGQTSQTITEDGDVVTIEVIEIRTEISGSAPPVIGSNIAGIPASGRVTKVVGQTVHVEARQGPLRITVDDKSITAKGRQGSRQDIRTGMAATATINDGNAVTLVIGPADLINLDQADQFRWMTP